MTETDSGQINGWWIFGIFRNVSVCSHSFVLSEEGARAVALAHCVRRLTSSTRDAYESSRIRFSLRSFVQA